MKEQEEGAQSSYKDITLCLSEDHLAPVEPQAALMINTIRPQHRPLTGRVSINTMTAMIALLDVAPVHREHWAPLLSAESFIRGDARRGRGHSLFSCRGMVIDKYKTPCKNAITLEQTVIVFPCLQHAATDPARSAGILLDRLLRSR